MFTLRKVSFFASSMTLIAALTANPAAADSFHACDAPVILLADDTVRRAEGFVGESSCYRLDLDTAGLLHLEGAAESGAVFLEIEAVRPAQKVPGLEVPDLSNGPEVLGRTASEVLVHAAAGSYRIEVHAEDPRQHVPAHRLSSRFLPVGKSETDGELELEPEKSETDGELELEPEKSETDGELELEPEKLAALPSIFSCGSTSKSETDGELELEPEKSETDGELELEPEKSETDGELELEPEKASACASIRPMLGRLCSETGDDHGDSLICARSLQDTAIGEIENGWGDDVDVFRFELDAWRTVEIVTGGEILLETSLFESSGQRLDRASEDDRLVRTLGPGVYFLRLEAHGQVGAYSVELMSVR